jgi:hypothetical protein
MTILASNRNVGIGTTSPSGKLHISSGGSPSIIIQDTDGTDQYATINHNNGSNQYIARNNTSNGQHVWFGQTGVSSFTERMRIDSSGNVGIGTASPSSTLDVKGTTTDNSAKTISAQDSGGTELFYVRNDGVVSVSNNYLYAQHSSGAYFEGSIKARGGITDDGGTLGLGASGDTSQLNIVGGGNVGIGTTSPGHKLSISGGNAQISHTEPTLFFNDTTTGHDDWKVYADWDKFYIQQYVNDSSYTTRLMSDASGNIGIGTNSPSEKLHVVGNIRIDSSNSNGQNLQFRNNGIANAIFSNTYNLAGGSTSKTDFNAYVYGDNPFSIWTNNNNRLTVLGGGNVGIGTTSPAQKLHVIGDARIQGNLTVNGTYTQIDTDVNTTEQWLVTNDGTGPAAVINQLGSQDIFDVQDDGTSVFYIEDGGHIGIGTTSPTDRLHLSGDNVNLSLDGTGAPGTPITTLSLSRGSVDWSINSGVGGANLFAIRDKQNSAYRLAIDGSGNVGIGTTSPSEKLEVSSAVGSTQLTGHQIFMTRNGNNEIYAVGASSVLALGANGVEKMRITSAGNVGIGTTSPSYKLDVNGGGVRLSSSNFHVYYGSYTGSWARGYLIQNSDASDQYGITGEFNNDSFEGLRIGKYVYDNKGIFIEKDGNVGIGTTSPSEKLEVAGKAIIRRTGTATAHSDTDLLVTDATASSSTAAIQILGGSAGYSNLQFSDTDSYSQGGILYNHSTDAMTIKTGASSAITIDSNQNVGIGTTTTNSLFHVNAADGVMVDTYMARIQNQEATAGDNFGLYVQAGSNSSDVSFRVTDKDANEYLRVRGDGNVGIGTTSPSEKLEVDGNVTISGYYYADTHFQSTDSNATLSAIGGGGVYLRPNGAFSTTGQFIVHHTTGNVDISGNLTINSTYPRIFLTDSNHNDDWSIINNDGKFGVYNDTDTSYALSIDGSNNVGIGTTSPSASLHIAADSPVIRLQDNTSSDNHYLTGNNGEFRIQTTGFLTLRPGNTESVRFLANGNVGIGTTSPSSKLQVDGNVKLNDTYRLKIGDSDDLQIYHDGSHSYIKENGTGNLRIDASNFYVRNSGGTKIAIDALDGAEVALRYDGSRKLETTSTGVEVTGSISSTGSVQRQISTTHHTFTTVNGGSATQDYWVPFIGTNELAAPNVTHRTVAPYGGILKKAIVHSTAAFGTSAQVRFHRIDNGTASVFTNDNSTDDVTTNVTRSLGLRLILQQNLFLLQVIRFQLEIK